MPVFGKSVMSRHFRTGCERLAKLELYPADRRARERARLGMPDPDPERPSSATTRSLGDEWERRKLGEIAAVLGPDRLLGERGPDGGHLATSIDDPRMLPSARA